MVDGIFSFSLKSWEDQGELSWHSTVLLAKAGTKHACTKGRGETRSPQNKTLWVSSELWHHQVTGQPGSQRKLPLGFAGFWGVLIPSWDRLKVLSGFASHGIKGKTVPQASKPGKSLRTWQVTLWVLMCCCPEGCQCCLLHPDYSRDA